MATSWRARAQCSPGKCAARCHHAIVGLRHVGRQLGPQQGGFCSQPRRPCRLPSSIFATFSSSSSSSSTSGPGAGRTLPAPLASSLQESMPASSPDDRAGKRTTLSEVIDATINLPWQKAASWLVVALLASLLKDFFGVSLKPCRPPARRLLLPATASGVCGSGLALFCIARPSSELSLMQPAVHWLGILGSLTPGKLQGILCSGLPLL